MPLAGGVPRGRRRSVRARIARDDGLERPGRAQVVADIPRRHRRSADCARSERRVRRECDLREGPRDGLEGPTERLRVRDGGVLIRLGHLIRAGPSPSSTGRPPL